jgi:hypothetical protein
MQKPTDTELNEDGLPFDDNDEYFAEIAKYSPKDQIESLKERILYMKAALDHANLTIRMLSQNRNDA